MADTGPVTNGNLFFITRDARAERGVTTQVEKGEKEAPLAFFRSGAPHGKKLSKGNTPFPCRHAAPRCVTKSNTHSPTRTFSAHTKSAKGARLEFRKRRAGDTNARKAKASPPFSWTRDAPFSKGRTRDFSTAADSSSVTVPASRFCDFLSGWLDYGLLLWAFGLAFGLSTARPFTPFRTLILPSETAGAFFCSSARHWARPTHSAYFTRGTHRFQGDSSHRENTGGRRGGKAERKGTPTQQPGGKRRKNQSKAVGKHGG